MAHRINLLPVVLALAAFAALLPIPALAQSAATSTGSASGARAAHIPILIYHSVRPFYPGITNLVKEFTVPPDIFDEQLAYLRDNGFTPVTFDELARYFADGTPLPARPVIITLDDGWENQYVYAYPILKKYGFRAVFYVYPGALGKLHFLTYAELKAMQADGMMIEGHSQTHPELPKITDPAALKVEIGGSKVILETKLGTPVKDFAYPFGEYNDQDIDLVRQSGYRTARTVHGGLAASAAAPFTIDGIIITSDFNRFVAWVNR